MTSDPKSNPNETGEDRIAALFRQYQQTRSVEARDRLAILHMNLVRFLAGKFANRGEPLDDLIQVGTIGLLNAIDRYDPDRGTKFSTYATPTIMGEIKRYFRDKSWNLKVPRHLQELNWAATRAIEALSQQLGRSPTLPEIARQIGATEEETIEAIELGNAHETVSLDTKLTMEGDSVPHTHGEMIGGPDERIAGIEEFEDLRAAIEQLDDREQAIILLRFYEEMSQTEVARRLNISQMHVSRLQAKALSRLKSLLSDQGIPGPSGRGGS